MIKYFFQILALCVLVSIVSILLEFNLKTVFGTIFLAILVFIQIRYILSRTSKLTAQDLRNQKGEKNLNLFLNAVKKANKEDSEHFIFDKFESHLKATDKKQPHSNKNKKKAINALIDASLEDVFLKSSDEVKEQKRNLSKSKPRKTLKSKDQEEASHIFDDMKINIKKQIQSRKNQVFEKTEKSIKTPINTSEEISVKDLELTGSKVEQEAQFVLAIGKKALATENYNQGLTAIQQWYQLLGTIKIDESVAWEIIFLKGKLEFLFGSIREATKSWEVLVSKYLLPTQKEYEEILLEIIDTFYSGEHFKESIQYSFTILNEYQKKEKREEMDRIYNKIEVAYEKIGDTERLIQTYQNHLAIKKVMKDYEGQLNILDHLGKLFFDQGDKKGSNSCYEQTIRVKKEMMSQTSS